MKKTYSRLGLPDLLQERTASTKTEEPTVIEEIVVEEVVAEEAVVKDDSEKNNKKAKSKKWSEVIAGEPEEVVAEN